MSNFNMGEKRMRSQIMSVRFSPQEKELLQAAAKEMGCPQADIVRWALRQVLAAVPKTPVSGRASHES
jgi:predicted DNA-binding protein